MSKTLLVNLLKETLSMVAVDPKFDKAYRTLKSDMKEHSFRVHYRTIVKQIKVQLAFRYAKSNLDKYQEFTSLTPENRKKIDTVIETEAKKIAAKAREGALADITSFNASNPQSRIDIQGGNSIFTVTAFIAIEDQEMVKRWKGGEEVPQGVFSRMKTYYTAQLRESEKVIYQALSIKDKKRTKQRLLDAGHFDETAVSLQQAKDAQSFFRDGFQDELKNVGITSRDLRNLGIDISVSKSSDYDTDKVMIYLQSSSANQSAGSKDAQKGPKAIMRDMLSKAIIRAEKSNARWTEAKGSDSRIDIEKKKVIKSFNKSLKKSSKLKTKSVGTKIEFSNVSKTSVKKEKGKISKAPSSQFKLGKLSKAPRSRQTESANSSVALASLINSKLAATVRENMGKPRLENQSGRFASSVKVTNVVSTKQGFPSIGYTYQKNPYQIFEQGVGKTPWATADRDPRKLIETSIRDIAKELLIGRFYTRRV